MFSDTTSACTVRCHSPTVSLTAPLCGEASQTSPDHPGYFRYRVLCELGLVRKERAPVNICSPSPANHNRAPGGSTAATKLPQGHSGKSGSRKQAALFTETWSLGRALRPRGLRRVRSTQMKPHVLVLPNIQSLSHLQRAIQLYRTLISAVAFDDDEDDDDDSQEIGGFEHLRVLNHVNSNNIQGPSMTQWSCRAQKGLW